MTVVIGDFNVKSHNWYKGDKTTASETKLEIMTSHYGLTQIVNEPIHLLEDASSCNRCFFYISAKYGPGWWEKSTF